MTDPLYETIGHGYTTTRREDPLLGRVIHTALGQPRTLVNVGAGAGSYEPRGPYVIAVEPSTVMAAQRPAERPALRAVAESLPLHDASVDAALAVLTLHHWGDPERGVRELRRVARQRVVILTYDAEVSATMWLMADYLPEVAELDRRIFPPPTAIASWLGRGAEVQPVPLHRDCVDWMLGSFWAHPERVLDEAARAATSGFARMSAAVVERVVSAVDHDLESGVWDGKYGDLRERAELDVGLRLVVWRNATS